MWNFFCTNRPKCIILLSLCVFTLFFSFVMSPNGHFSVDEGMYHLMTRSFADSASLEIWNGYEEYPSSELVLLNAQVHDGHLMPQYPYLFPILATPFYMLAGYHGLFIFNAFAYLGVVGFCFALAYKIFDDSNIALNSCLILILSTYSWEYSQAAWPHAVSMLFITGSFYFATISAIEAAPKKSVKLSFVAGAIAGIGAGVRLDVIFVLPAIIALFIFVRPSMPRILTTILGTVPGLVLLTVSNYIKFKQVSPFSYGTTEGATAGIGPYLPLAVLALFLSAGGWVLRRHAVQLAQLPRNVTLILLVLGLVIFLVPGIMHFFTALAFGAYQLIVDLRMRSLEVPEPALTRTSDGAMVYLGLGLKKSLLQSCPYLSALVFPWAATIRARKYGLSLVSLYLVPLVFVGVFSFFAWHGGLCFNLRYFLPIFPFTSIVSAFVWRELTRELSSCWCKTIFVAGFFSFALCLIAINNQPTDKQEVLYLAIPIVFSLFLILLLFLLSIKKRVCTNTFLKGVSSVVLLISLVYSGSVAIFYDFVRSYVMRSTYSSVSESASKVVSSDSILFTNSLDAFFGLGEKERVRLAVPTNDNFDDFRALADYHLESGRPVYLSFDPVTFQAMKADGLLKSLTIVPLFEHRFGSFVQVLESANDF